MARYSADVVIGDWHAVRVTCTRAEKVFGHFMLLHHVTVLAWWSTRSHFFTRAISAQRQSVFEKSELGLLYSR